MTYNEIADMIKEIGIPSSYYQFEEDTAVPPPFICYYYPEQNGFYADDITYARRERLVIEIYTRGKDVSLEGKVQEVLTKNRMPFRRYESYIDTERLYMNTYETEVFING